MAALLLLRAIPVVRHRLIQRNSAVGFVSWTGASSIFRGTDHRCQPQDNVNSNNINGGGVAESVTTDSINEAPSTNFSRLQKSPEVRQWKVSEAEILRDIEQIVSLTKEILHSDRYEDGEILSNEDEKAVVEKLLAYHPNAEDKIGPGLHSIMVDRHPQFKHSRCLFVVRTDSAWIDFSYHKCLRAYIRDKHPSDAERFIRKHFKRGSN